MEFSDFIVDGSFSKWPKYHYLSYNISLFKPLPVIGIITKTVIIIKKSPKTPYYIDIMHLCNVKC